MAPVANGKNLGVVDTDGKYAAGLSMTPVEICHRYQQR
jgi:hypothetical protein